jgi:hypothetical protein
MTAPREKFKRAGAILGCVFFIFASLGIALHQTHTLNRLLSDGRRAEAVVTDIDVGVKGGKNAVLEFVTVDGLIVRAKDMFPMMFVRHRRGDKVTALYDPANPSRATVDLGGWMWQVPAFLYFGAAFLTGLLFLILKAERVPPN